MPDKPAKASNCLRVTKQWVIFTLCSVSLLSCQQQAQSVRFKVDSARATLCDSKVPRDSDWVVERLLLYISELTINQKPAKLVGGPFSTDGVTLIGTDCAQVTNWQLPVQQLPTDQPMSLRFIVGVPSELNHANPLTAKSPLNLSGMFWSWRMGYKFINLEMTRPDDQWFFHLGSTGCRSASPMRAPNTECKNPNRFEVVINNWQPQQPIQINLDNLLNGIILNEANNCQSELENTTCEILITNLQSTTDQQGVFSR